MGSKPHALYSIQTLFIFGRQWKLIYLLFTSTIISTFDVFSFSSAAGNSLCWPVEPTAADSSWRLCQLDHTLCPGRTACSTDGGSSSISFAARFALTGLFYDERFHGRLLLLLYRLTISASAIFSFGGLCAASSAFYYVYRRRTLTLYFYLQSFGWSSGAFGAASFCAGNGLVVLRRPMKANVAARWPGDWFSVLS